MDTLYTVLTILALIGIACYGAWDTVKCRHELNKKRDRRSTDKHVIQ